MKKKKLIKNRCEIDDCTVSDPDLLHLHHVIERTELNTNNNNNNLCILCANCHNLIHAGKIKIIGIYPSTKLPNGRTVIYEKNGKRNLDGIDTAYIEVKPKGMRIINES